MSGDPPPGLHTAERANVTQLLPAGMAGTTRLIRSKCTTPPGSGLWAVSKSSKGVTSPAGKSLMVFSGVEPTTNTAGSWPDIVSWIAGGGFEHTDTLLKLKQALLNPS